MNKWPHPVKGMTRCEIMTAIKYQPWQDLRLILKGKTTALKLTMLHNWMLAERRSGNQSRDIQVCVDNYLNALKRGGQLNSNLEVVK